MDKWMNNPTLNANKAVETWHKRAQRCGFKFLVTQLIGYLTGGPQRYTGKSMALSHKHLAITAREWDAFMAAFYSVTEEFDLPTSDVEDLQAVLFSMRDDCISEGTAADAHPAVSTATGTVVSSLAYAETRLLLPARQMFFLLEAAKDASDHIPSSKLRAELLQALHQASADYIVDKRTSSPLSQRHSERAVQIEALSRRAGVPLIYIPKGGVVRITFNASPAQLEQVAA